MKMDKVANSGNDEFYTPEYAIEPMVKYISKGSHAWCPFDTPDSLFIKVLNAHGISVHNSHISNGQDFFTMDVPDNITHIVSNPPYSTKGEVFERLFSLRNDERYCHISFAMLVGVVGLFESQKRFNMFKNNQFEIMYLNRRVAYFKNYADAKPSLNPPFSSVWLCSGLLPDRIVFEEITK